MKKHVQFVLIVLLALAPFYAMAENAAIKPEPRNEQSWMARHNSFNDRVKQGNADLLFIGDSITHGWEGGGKATWDKYYAKRNAVNLGISGDRTQHVLWRLDNGNIAGIKPKAAVVMIGTNNYKDNTVPEIAEGVKAIVDKLQANLPEMKILLLAIFPRDEKPGETRTKLADINELLAKLDNNKTVFFLDIGRKFLEPDGTLPKSVMPDALHPNEKGYEIWAGAIEEKLAGLLGDEPTK